MIVSNQQPHLTVTLSYLICWFSYPPSFGQKNRMPTCYQLTLIPIVFSGRHGKDLGNSDILCDLFIGVIINGDQVIDLHNSVHPCSPSQQSIILVVSFLFVAHGSPSDSSPHLPIACHVCLDYGFTQLPTRAPIHSTPRIRVSQLSLGSSTRLAADGNFPANCARSRLHWLAREFPPQGRDMRWFYHPAVHGRMTRKTGNRRNHTYMYVKCSTVYA